jgi:hypothetical protein
MVFRTAKHNKPIYPNNENEVVNLFKYTRESIFKHNDVLKLDYFEEEEIIKYFSTLNKRDFFQNKLNLELKLFSEKYYNEGDQKRVKELLKFRRKIQSGKTCDLPKFTPKKIVDLASSYFKTVEESRRRSAILKNIFFSNSFSYKYFLEKEHFQQAIKYTNPKAFTQVFDENKYHKGKYKKTRYSYIQRNILKTNSISWMGLTSFDVEGSEKIQEKVILNQYFVTALIFLVSNDPSLRREMKFVIGEFAKREEITCYIQRMYYTSTTSNTFFVRENVLFKQGLVQLLMVMKDEKYDTGKKLEAFLENKEENIDFLLNNHLILPDFDYYSQKENLIKLLNKSKVFGIIASQIERSGSDEIKNKIMLSVQEVAYLKELETNYFDKSILKIVLDEPIWINLVSRLGTNSAVELFNTQFKEYQKLQQCVEVHNQYSRIVSLIKEYSSAGLNNVLDIFLKIEAEIMYRESYWQKTPHNDLKQKEVYIDEEKSYLVMFTIDKNGKVLLTNVYPGNGFLLGREFNKVDRHKLSLMEDHIKNINGSDKEIYEVVIDPEISSLINTGKSNYPKLYWPNDFKDVKVNYENGVTFFYKNTEIRPVYFGSVPIHLFYGAKGLFLKAISPWGMTRDMAANINKINNRKSLKVNSEILNSCLVKDQFETYLNILRYFRNVKFPLKFFMQKNGLGVQKPMYISLLNKEGYEIFMNVITNSEVILTVLDPNPSNYKKNEKLFEHINIITEKEIIDHVEKLSYL